MKRTAFFLATFVLAATVFAGCSALFGSKDDTIVGTWQQASVNGTAPLLVNIVQFNGNNSYTGSTAGQTTNSGTWSSSGNTYTLSGSIFGFISTTATITPTFTSSDNTLTYTDGNGAVEVYNRK